MGGGCRMRTAFATERARSKRVSSSRASSSDSAQTPADASWSQSKAGVGW